MATKSVSTFAIFFILFLVIFEVPDTKAQDSECLKEYGGDVGFSYCAPQIYPSFCYQNCIKNKGAYGGICVWGDAEAGGVKCLCDFCSLDPGSGLNEPGSSLNNEVPETKAQDNECLEEYGGDVGFSFCAPRIFPTFCYQNCRTDKGAKGGRCVWGDADSGGVKCLCDFCSDKPGSDLNDRYTF